MNAATPTRASSSRPHADVVMGTCAISGKQVPEDELVPVQVLRPTLAARIREDHPDLAASASVSRAVLNTYLLRHVEDLMAEERGELTALDRQIAKSLAQGELMSKDTERDYTEQRSLGERLSDGLANFGGSWSFLITFAALLLLWIGANILLLDRSFDPYPFILLNLILSCLAAVQAPIIMMSQKRQEAKDRLRSLNDYRVNLKAELEIRHLHEKLDHLITKQWQRLAEIQQLQIELMQARGGPEVAPPERPDQSRESPAR